MEWVALTLLASLLWSIVVIIDKYVSSKEVKDFISLSTIGGFLKGIILMILASLIGNPFNINSVVVLIGITAGMVYRLATTFYYAALKYGEASQVDPLINSQPIFVLFISYFMFGEIFGVITYIGIFLVMAGAFIISCEDIKHLKMNKVFLIGIFAAGIYAIRSLLLKYGTLQTDVWSLLFWIGVGQGLTAWILTTFHHPRLTKENLKGVKHTIFSVAITVVAFIAFLKALAIGPVTLVTTLVLSELFFVFMIATFLSFIFPNIMQEKINKQDLIRKLIAIVVMVIGLVMVV